MESEHHHEYPFAMGIPACPWQPAMETKNATPNKNKRRESSSSSMSDLESNLNLHNVRNSMHIQNAYVACFCSYELRLFFLKNWNLAVLKPYALKCVFCLGPFFRLLDLGVCLGVETTTVSVLRFLFPWPAFYNTSFARKTHRTRQRQGSSQRGSGCLARLASLGSLGYSVVIYKKHSIEPDSGMEVGKGEAGAGRLSGCWSGVEPKLRHTCSCGRGARGRKGEGRIGREGRGTGGREEEPGEGERRGRGRLSIEK